MNWVSNLVTWFHKNQRVMPWRSNPTPYNVWVSEMMLQQTQVATVIPYFNRFMVCFPTVQRLAEADVDHVLKAWEGLGYYSRARNLHKAARLVVNAFNAELPCDYVELQKIPGIGPYCAAAIGSIAFGVKVPVVDGNVLRVFTRFWGIKENIAHSKTRVLIFDKLTPFIQTVHASDFNQGIMELGALICKLSQPDCKICPLAFKCVAYKKKLTDVLPVKTKTKKVPHYDIAVAVIWDDTKKILIGQRKKTQMLGGLWEFPGGKINEKESPTDAVIREVKEETNLDVLVGNQLCKIKHAFSHFKITLHVYECHQPKGTLKALSADSLQWVNVDCLEKFAFPTANKKIINVLNNL